MIYSLSIFFSALGCSYKNSIVEQAQQEDSALQKVTLNKRFGCSLLENVSYQVSPDYGVWVIGDTAE